ncbi:SRPBCC family protein [Bacillus sp. JJ664]
MSHTIHQENIFNVSPNEIFQILTESNKFSELTGGAPTEIHNEAGGSFSLFGGMIHGRNIELVENKLIVQAWRAGNWNEGVYSLVRFELKEHESGTMVILDHTGFPEGQDEHLSIGWIENYWKPLKKYISK